MVLEEGWFPKTKSATYFKFVKDDFSAPQHSRHETKVEYLRLKTDVKADQHKHPTPTARRGVAPKGDVTKFGSFPTFSLTECV